MTSEWMPIFVLPNVPLDNAIGCCIAAIAPAHDRRVAVLKRAYPTFRRFLNRFADNFGEKFEPSILLLNTSAPPIYRDVGTLASFRDLVALSAVTRGRALELRYPRGMRVLFGDAFAIYPWMLDRNYEDIIGNTPAILGTHELARFKGQSSPAVFRTPLGENDIDQPLLAELMTRWRRRYEESEPLWADVALMRSLNMAYQASLMPAGTDTTFYDVGRIVSLWVSAFEILVHPGGNGRANRDKVFDLIESMRWEIPASSQLAHDTGSKAKPEKRTLASSLYQVLHESRNDFLHGNPVERDNLVLRTPQRSIFEYAAPLYRIALTAFLPLSYGALLPSAHDTEAFGAYIVDHMTYMDPQKDAEEALLTAMRSPEDRRTRRSRVIRPVD
ncbi:hypothetical protein LP7551_05403 [Roseibium album]|nr:hypothetical protein LP7551_05403 [Roseibium album]